MTRLALVVRSAPWAERSGREALDLALSALTMDIPVKVFFIGDGLLQLVADRDPSGAGLPPGQKAWAGLEAMGDIDFFADAGALETLSEAGLALVLTPLPVGPGGMPSLQANHQVLVV